MTHTFRHIPKPWVGRHQPPPGLSLCGVFVLDDDETPRDALLCPSCQWARDLQRRAAR